jgi:hypothetical protein
VSLFGFLRRRHPPLDKVSATVVEIEPDGSALAKPWFARPGDRIPISRRDVRRLGLVFGTLVDIGLDPDTGQPRLVRPMFHDGRR